MLVKLIAGAALAALALTLGVFYGAGAVAVLAFFVLWTGLVVTFLVLWGDIARRGGSWYYRRQSGER